MAPPRRYAEDTTVPTERSIGEIHEMATRYGGRNWSQGQNDDSVPKTAWIEFRLQGYLLRFTVIRPKGAQEERANWRKLVLLLKAKLVAISEGVVRVEEEMLPHIVLGDTTVGEWVAPRLKELQEAASRGNLPQLPAPTITEVKQ